MTKEDDFEKLPEGDVPAPQQKGAKKEDPCLINHLRLAKTTGPHFEERSQFCRFDNCAGSAVAFFLYGTCMKDRTWRRTTEQNICMVPGHAVRLGPVL